jgi:hypothetical protein
MKNIFTLMFAFSMSVFLIIAMVLASSHVLSGI